MSCIVVETRPLDFEHDFDRYECIVTTYPSQVDFLTFATQILMNTLPQANSFLTNNQDIVVSGQYSYHRIIMYLHMHDHEDLFLFL